MKQGKCYACDAAGPEDREEDFLCGECLNSEAAVVVCANCKERRVFDTDKGIQLLSEYFPSDCEIDRGSVLRIECCATCTDIIPEERSTLHISAVET